MAAMMLRPTLRSTLPLARRMALPAAANIHSSSRLRTRDHAESMKVLEQTPEVCTDLHNAKIQKGLTFEGMAKDMGRSEVWVAALFFGQAKPEPKDLDKLSELTGIDRAYLEQTLGAHFFPGRGLEPMPPTDALIYRLYEIVAIFGWPIKSVIQEKVGDGIVSAIDCKFFVDKVNEDGADRIKITINGKWLPYRRF